ncbi:GNAT family N-acetyltransferase [Loktanella sp. 3ANDIMAR09]|uniref:GNAT family N-acetyltransferase n=1 Tax=Loktanella sp. 3ANDIMAR09 TaxID=1225657 RepID=UPI00209CEDCF|nr:GNAT family N-acetyltransferase [Loktanella sp. 3ANDIMAR09]
MTTLTSKTADPVLVTARLVLRRPASGDLDDLFAIYSDPCAMRYWSTLPHDSPAVTSRSLDGMMAQSPLTYFALDLNGRVIGCAGLYRDQEVGFILHPDHWRQGYVTEAMNAIIPYLFATTQVPHLMADIDPRNIASAAALTGLGFTETHRATRTYCIGGVWSDSAYYRLHRPDT